jgi:hypothetical protein
MGFYMVAEDAVEISVYLHDNGTEIFSVSWLFPDELPGSFGVANIMKNVQEKCVKRAK